VNLLKQAFRNHYGTIDDNAVIKITGAADKPLQLIRRYKNERNPNVAVTVDLLTTSVDVPEICNLLSEANARDFETRAGMPPEAFIQKLRAMPLARHRGLVHAEPRPRRDPRP
jgi:hypothetical protein